MSPDVTGELPEVSVVLPVRNEGAAFAETLRTVLDQDYPPGRMEVLVVDGRSTDETRAVTERFARDDARVRLLDNPGRIVPTAMNRGIRAARGEVIVRVDGHTRIEPDYVRRCVETLATSGAQCVGGCMTPRGATFVGRLVEVATSGPFGVGGAHFHYSTHARETDTVYLGAWPRAVLVGLGGFDEEMVRNQDDELNYRLRAGGGKVWLDPSIRSEYRPRGALRRLWRQYFQYGYWKVRVFQKHPPMMRPRHFAPALCVLVGLALGAAAWLDPRWLPWLGALALLYAGAGWIAAASARPGIVPTALMPIVYFVIHAAYGTGFLVGLVRFVGRWFDRAPARGALAPAGGDESRGDRR